MKMSLCSSSGLNHQYASANRALASTVIVVYTLLLIFLLQNPFLPHYRLARQPSPA